ncbi:hypothetical protein P7228_11970 [Altererythrobacter arenosus]|uniref:Helix-turn-helix domain-containing protein n=1 Tax=Altererythrobacter arenosus TaxID=3032592 RepID=A0ABY8FNW3_9SPHN|nr:hypothetical protein [Altererythrobacter sp. CAU 1644]WFL76710.1 hypothetical protein P7228_11970 [Altererythrobacter sp. CAU 1644]
MTVQLPVPYEYEHKPIFSPQSQSKFLEHLATSGNVRLACKAAGVSPQTAYRARRKSAHLAAIWDAALLSARHHAEEVLADRALNGVEEAVYYHGEEVGARRRYSDRLLLAHLARLDRLAERAEVAEALARLDDAIEGLGRGEELPHTAHPEPFDNAQDRPVEGRAEDQATLLRQAQDDRFSLHQDRVPSVPSSRDSHPETPAKPVKPCRDCGGMCDTPRAVLGPGDCQFLDNRRDRMEAARPFDAPTPRDLAESHAQVCAIEAFQLEAFEAEGHEWWLVTSEEELCASALHGMSEEELARLGGDLLPTAAEGGLAEAGAGPVQSAFRDSR